MNERFPDRCFIRFSGPAEAEPAMGATTIWRMPEAPVVPEGQVCPPQIGRSGCCGTCTLCFAPAMRGKRIVFVGHGIKRRGRPPGSKNRHG